MSLLSTQYSLWFLPICLAGSFLFAWFLYRKDKKLKDVPHFAKKALFLMRFLSVGIISFLLLSPIIRSFGKTIEKPIIIYAQDNSESMLPDKANIQAINKELQKAFKNNKNYTFKTFTFGESLRENDTFRLNEKETDIAAMLSDIKNSFYQQNVGALILASDGIYNKGANPDYETDNINFPVYSLALGDTSIRKDLVLNNVKYNEKTFLNVEFPIKVNVKADKLKGESSFLKLYDGNKEIHSRKIKITSDNFFETYTIKVKAPKTGFHNYTLSLSPINNEITDKNNTKQIIVEVSDKKQRILILSDAPHPDISALMQALKLNKNFETEYYSASEFKKSVKLYNLLILNQLPSKNNIATSVLKPALESDIPIIYMLGNNSSLQKFDALNTGLSTGAYSNKPDEVKAALNPDFSLFDIDENIETISSNAPPLISAFGDYKLSGMHHILFYRTINGINTKLPLMVFNTGAGNRKSAIITGEGIWRWRMYDYKANQNHYLFNELINKAVQYLISKEDKTRLNILHEKIIPENHNVLIKAEVYDKDFSLTNADKLRFFVEDSTGQTSEYTFKKQGKKYRLNIGKLPAGNYKWHATAKIDEKKYTKNGIFSIVPVYSEYRKTQANHSGLYKLSKHTGGKVFYPQKVADLWETIKQNDNIKPVSYSEKKTEFLINYKLLFFIILILLAAEWFMRKIYGTY